MFVTPSANSMCRSYTYIAFIRNSILKDRAIIDFELSHYIYYTFGTSLYVHHIY